MMLTKDAVKMLDQLLNWRGERWLRAKFLWVAVRPELSALRPGAMFLRREEPRFGTEGFLRARFRPVLVQIPSLARKQQDLYAANGIERNLQTNAITYIVFKR